MSALDDLRAAVLEGRRKEVEALTKAALAEGVEPASIARDALIPAMQEVGDRFSRGEYFVPEMLIAAKAMKTAMEIIRPQLAGTGYKPAGRVIIGTVRGDLHDIGKNLVKMMLEGAGFEVVDLGVDVSPEKFVAGVREHHPQIVAMSALLTTTMLAMPDTIKALGAAGVRGGVKVMIGGAATTEAFAREIAADGYGSDAATAVATAKRLVAA